MHKRRVSDPLWSFAAGILVRLPRLPLALVVAVGDGLLGFMFVFWLLGLFGWLVGWLLEVGHFVWLFACYCRFLVVCLLICLIDGLFVCVFVCLLAWLLVCLSVCLPVWLSVFVCVLKCLFVRVLACSITFLT